MEKKISDEDRNIKEIKMYKAQPSQTIQTLMTSMWFMSRNSSQQVMYPNSKLLVAKIVNDRINY